MCPSTPLPGGAWSGARFFAAARWAKIRRRLRKDWFGGGPSTMVATNFAVQTIQTLIDAARAQLVRVLAAETHQSFPVPVLDPKGVRIAFLYCPAIRVHAG